jgi:hypothetical protein
MRERGISFKEALNSAIRTGTAPGRAAAPRRFKQKTYALGAEQNFRWDKTLSAAASIEDEELIRKVSLRK